MGRACCEPLCLGSTVVDLCLDLLAWDGGVEVVWAAFERYYESLVYSKLTVESHCGRACLCVSLDSGQYDQNSHFLSHISSIYHGRNSKRHCRVQVELHSLSSFSKLLNLAYI